MESLVDLTVKSIYAVSRQKTILMALASFDFSPLILTTSNGRKRGYEKLAFPSERSTRCAPRFGAKPYGESWSLVAYCR